MNLRIHIFQHVPFEDAGCILDWCREKNHTVRYTRFFRGDSLPEPADFDWLIIMGGPMGVYDEKQYSWLGPEKEAIKTAIRSGKTVLGICLGSQLIAECLGSRVYSNTEKEIGWFDVKLTEKGHSERILSDMLPETTVFHWHGDTFDLPEQAVNLVFSDGCKNQLFIYGHRVMGIQFHFEVTRDSLAAMLENGKHELIPGKFVQNENDILSGFHYINANNRIMFSILDRLSGFEL